ncbi:Laminin subunit beta-4 [Camelus dromedarius]|uniref:Laminin subunit beta-4 n=1 Tax=Camelus dromedarius TaxID=9838 RepID=A0A5N4DYN2_CAMDR|nr:Laminin subunit beta-4 [Camelus dromedarius]
MDLEALFQFSHLVLTFKVVLKVLDPSFEIEDPYSPHIQACRCNSHSDRCHFDMTAYVASDGHSGNVCDNCQHNTEGQHCDHRRPFFYRDPPQGHLGSLHVHWFSLQEEPKNDSTYPWNMFFCDGGGQIYFLNHVSEIWSRDLGDISEQSLLTACECDPNGTISGGICVSHSDPDLESVAGQCLCKENVEGAKCDRCKPNHYGLSATDPLGCQPCNGNPLGSLPVLTCDADTGQCLSRSFAAGPRCEECPVCIVL